MQVYKTLDFLLINLLFVQEIYMETNETFLNYPVTSRRFRI